MNKHQLLLLLACLTSLLVKAQSEEMETDRPGQSLTPQTTVKRTVQVEVG